MRAVQPGDLVWKNRDPALERRLRASYEALPAASQRRLPLAVSMRAVVGQPLRVTLTDEQVGWSVVFGGWGADRKASSKPCCVRLSARAAQSPGAADLQPECWLLHT